MTHAALMLSSEQRRQFSQDGICVLKGFHDLEQEIRPIQSGIYQIIDLVARRHGVDLPREPFLGNNFDCGYPELIAANRVYGGEIYDLVKQIPAFIRLISSPVSVNRTGF